MSYLEDAFITVLNMSITASYVAIAVIIARLLLRKAPKVFSYALWSIVLFRLVCPFSFSSEFSLLGFIQSSQAGGFSTRYMQDNIELAPSLTMNTGADNVNAAFKTLLPAAAAITKADPMQVLITLGTIIWLAGAIVLLVYALVSYLRLKRQISMATLVTENIYETEFIRSPFVFGFIKPRIYLPLSLTGNEREYILCHEKIHIKRRDYLVKLIAFLALVLHWFNPLMWLCFSLMTKDMEMSCDERVIQSMGTEGAVGYSSSLLVLAMNKRVPGLSPLSFGEGNVKARIKNILNYKKPAFWVIVTCIVAVITLSVILVSNPVKWLGIYEHPETFLSQNSLRVPAKLRIVDNISGNEITLTDANEIAQVTAIVENMRISNKKIDNARGGETGSRYSISYYKDINNSLSEYSYTVHIDPVWIDNNVKTSPSFSLINKKETLARLEKLFAGKYPRAVYDIDFLMKNKTKYIGNHVKVGALLSGMPMPEGVSRGIMELSTTKPPYGVTYHYILNDDSVVVSEEQFLRNSILLFALIDNADVVTHLGHWNNESLSSNPFRFTYTRADAERVVGGDVRQFAKDKESLAELVEIVKILRAGNSNDGRTNNSSNDSSPNDTKAPFKGLELYVWRKPELTGNNNIYYTLLLGTNRNKTDEEIYDLSVATTDIEVINRKIASYGEVDIIVSHPVYISKEEMKKIVDQIKVKNGLVAVGTGLFGESDPDAVSDAVSDAESMDREEAEVIRKD
ncbi:MAG TPA: DUF4825 domain-containing protein [Clostridiaceae bacterium]|nr:DUF4825 domain-containing protein [Clostridiaceae bacterium]